MTRSTTPRHNAGHLNEVLSAERTLSIVRRRADVAATLIRAHSIFRSAIALVDAEEPGGLGILVRALFEEWLVAVLLAEGDEEDRARLLADYQWWAEDHAPQWNVDPPPRLPGIVPARWGVWRRVERVDELAAGQTARGWYNWLYRVESFSSAHAGYGTLSRHQRLGDDPNSGALIHNPYDQDEIGRRLDVATIVMANVALQVWELAGIDTTILHEIADACSPGGPAADR